MFETTRQHLDLLPFLAETPLSRRLEQDFGSISFGRVTLRLYGSAATVTRVGDPTERLVPYIPASGIRRFLERIGFLSPPRLARHLLSYGDVPGEFAPSYRQIIDLRFPQGSEARFEVRHVASTGLRLKPQDHITVIFSSVGGDFVPLAIKHGLDWTWLYGDIVERLELAGVCHGDYAADKFQGIVGMLRGI